MTSDPGSPHAAGWYPDPHGLFESRWWNGSAWTKDVRASVQDSPVERPVSQTAPLTPSEPRDELLIPPVVGVVKTERRPPARHVPLRGRPIYWSNLFRWRYWQFTILGPLILGILPGVLFGPLFYVVFIGGMLTIGWYWLHVQMACNACGRILAVTKLTGELEVCKHCRTPTDVALARGA